MQVIELGQPYDGPIALALGYFDGMHLGHRTILNKAVELAAKYGARTAVTTFADSPNRTDPIYTYNERKKLFAECGDMSVVDLYPHMQYARARVF